MELRESEKIDEGIGKSGRARGRRDRSMGGKKQNKKRKNHKNKMDT